MNKKEAIELFYSDLLELMRKAYSLKKDKYITYSKNVFIPVTTFCRNKCGYCIFRNENYKKPLMMPKEVLSKLKLAEKYGCKEALFTMGEIDDSVEPVNNILDRLGYENMVEYVYYLCNETLEETSLLPHTNMGVLSFKDLKILKEVNASMGLMLENISERLMETVAHKNSPGKDPKLRLKTIENAGKLKIPFTTGLLIGIGETVEERIESLLKLRKIHDKYGHIQEIIIQNFKPKPGTPMENYPEPSLIEMLRTVAVTKLIFPDVSVQIPPNLNRETAQLFIFAGADDWGGVSPITKDYVNPESKWPEIDELKNLTEEAGFKLKERLPVYPKFISEEFLSKKILQKINELKHQ
ncbi:FO synthase subunit 1 [Methanothermus fervidus DSM 2088]|uniref:7,8-didemethyl-8-hydroxy-5-deazariboflavin synthase n=1 Tax=Methanothermus fervidus (strain ATCC 43054 / DSM 2088 / JCM 10308 / V24 S) TaxID=523846 RepID=E3GY15_METFV|nr:7,8-didemethyl-8-hydroxy-5-deazariboflavin synthase subunit CofG [Methanothermus fervidus]ADP77197.1 FO synthase subunit 1 [Methanothermus fervidus DSM 2088]